MEDLTPPSWQEVIGEFDCGLAIVTTSALARGRGGGGKLRNCGVGGLLLAFEFFL